MKRMRLLSLAVLPVVFAQCAPSGCAPGTPAPPPASSCDRNYTGCVPIDSDVDCEGGQGDGPSYTGMVKVIGIDVYELDRNGDGWACEPAP